MTGLRVYAESLSDPNVIAERVRSHMPLVRKIVNSEVCANLAITKMVPIKTVMGSNS